MDPGTLGILSLVGSVVSGAVGFMGQQQQAKAQAESLNYQAAVARNNQIIADQNAQQAAQAGAVQAQARDLRTRAVVGQIESAQSASGIDTETGSSKEVRESAENLGRLDTATVLSNALQQSRGYSVQGVNFGAQAGLDTMSAANARSAGNVAGFSSLLGGATSFADKWMRYRTEGVL